MTLDEMKIAKKEHGFSCEEIAKRTDIPYRTVQKIFSGETKHPRQDTMDKLYRLFDGVTLSKDPFEKIYYNFSEEPHVLVVREPGPEYRTVQGPATLKDLENLKDGERAELIDGVLIKMESPTIRHQIAVREVFRQFDSFIRACGGKCQPFFAPVDVHMINGNGKMDVFVPDFLVVCNPDQIKEKFIDGGPDFCLEVLSPSTRVRDVRKKVTKYLEGGVKEYWVIDTDARKVVVYLSEEIPRVYGFDVPIPVVIYGGELMIDLSKL
ncbi:MAG: Uma2 family endonuclease [Lachnospiraceae bacterium]|nr:Uma2 family endonuclease [Lachnospiraceae bacterium]